MARKLKFGSGFTLKRLDLAIKGLTNTSYLGGYKSAFKGAGLEFEEYRNYNSNDDASRIDWKASKRVGQLVVKEFKEERNVNVYFLIDCSSSMLAGSTKMLKAEYVAEMTSTLTQSILGAGDSVGLIMFSDSIKKELRKASGMTQYYAITNELAKVSIYGGYGDCNKVLEYAYNTLEQDSLVVLISDFVGEINSDRFLKLAARKFDLMLIMIRDPRDMSLPEGEGEVFLEDPNSGTTLLVRPQEIRKEFAKEVTNEIHNLDRTLKKVGAEFLLIPTDKPYLKELITFFQRREKTWR